MPYREAAPPNRRARVWAQARRDLAEGRNEQALSRLHSLGNTDPAEVAVWDEMARVYLAIGDPVRAGRALLLGSREDDVATQLCHGFVRGPRMTYRARGPYVARALASLHVAPVVDQRLRAFYGDDWRTTGNYRLTGDPSPTQRRLSKILLASAMAGTVLAVLHALVP
ncbi:MAG: DUF6584 family protein [Polyangia bacterium]